MQPALHSSLSRVFMNGNSQAVRIPQQFRLDTDQVEIYRNLEGDLVLHALPAAPAKRGTALLKALGAFDAEFIAALEQGQREQAPMQERDGL
jgi:antitoxin VapB